VPQPKKGSKSNVLERNIHFYSSFCGTDESGKPVLYKQGAALAFIDKLPFTDQSTSGGRYFRDQVNVYCCWIDSPNKLRFAVIRRDAFPQVEEEGLVSALNVPATAGLVEQIHVRFFPRNVVGFDFNFYGPRLPRLGIYLNRVAAGKTRKVAFWPLLRQDAAKELEGNKDLRVFSFRTRRSMIDTVSKADRSLGDALEATANIGKGDEIQVIVRPKAFSRDSPIDHKFMQIARKMARRNDLRQLASEFKVELMEPGKASAALDLLGDRFIADARILRLTKTGRALDSEDAFAKIEAAHEDRQKELERAAALAPQ
jgi:hypothetical protein